MESLNEVDNATPPPASHSDPPQASPSCGGGDNSQSHSPTRIPKKNNNNQQPMKQPSNSSENENPIVLPNGVHLPSTVTPQMLEGRIRRAFLDLTPAQMRDVLQEYDDAVNQKGDEIRNRSAYLFGVVKRYKVAVDRGGGDFAPQGNVSDRVQTRLDALISSGFCTASEIDAKIRDRIRMMPERDALDAIDELNGCSRKDIRNFASYFMGIMNKYMKGERNDPRSRGANRVRNHRDGHKNNAANDDRLSHYGRNDDHGSSARHRRDGRGDGRDRQSSMRDGDRDHNRSRRRSRSRSRSYDSRSRSRSPDYRRRRRSRSRSDSRDRHHSSRRHNRSSRDGSTRTSSNRDPNIPSTYSMIPPPPPPPLRPQTMMQPMTMGQQQQLLPGQPPQVMVHGLQRPMQPPQQQFVQSIGQIPQLGQDAQLNTYLQQYQQQLLQQQQFQQSVPGSNIPQQSLQHMQNYNQNMQQLNQAGKMMPGNVAGLTNMMLGQQGPGSQPGNATNMYSVQNPDQQPLLDIFGLADKAAQALSGRLPQDNPNAASVATMSNPNFPPLLTPANLSAPAFQSLQQNTSSRQQKATATESELPMMVQYAIQNLRTTGHIESSLDAPLIAMLQRLPENAALSALEIFSSCDLSKMRSKAAYLAGILKKELAKLGLQ